MTTRDFRDRRRRDDSEETPFQERVVRISRVSQVAKGGRHLSFNALVVVGDGDGNVGIGIGKADAVPDAVRKGTTDARKNVIHIVMKDGTIPHDITAKYGASEVMLRPAPPGTGVIAGGAVRAVVELAGITDVVTKSRRSTNPINTVKAAYKALSLLKSVEEELGKRKRTIEMAAARERHNNRA